MAAAAVAKKVVDPNLATGLIQPGGIVPPPPVPEGPKVPAYVFANHNGGAQRMEIGPSRYFTFGPVGEWSTTDLELGAKLAAVASRYDIEVVSTPSK